MFTKTYFASFTQRDTKGALIGETCFIRSFSLFKCKGEIYDYMYSVAVDNLGALSEDRIYCISFNEV